MSQPRFSLSILSAKVGERPRFIRRISGSLLVTHYGSFDFMSNDRWSCLSRLLRGRILIHFISSREGNNPPKCLLFRWNFPPRKTTITTKHTDSHLLFCLCRTQLLLKLFFDHFKGTLGILRWLRDLIEDFDVGLANVAEGEVIRREGRFLFFTFDDYVQLVERSASVCPSSRPWLDVALRGTTRSDRENARIHVSYRWQSRFVDA